MLDMLWSPMPYAPARPGTASNWIVRSNSCEPSITAALIPCVGASEKSTRLAMSPVISSGRSSIRPVIPPPPWMHSPVPVRLVELEYEPSLHGSAALAPSGQYEPGSQATHVCSPALAWYFPAVHPSQKAAPEAAATKPAEQFLQSAGSELPGIGLAFPGAHAWHDALLFWPRSGLNVPARHGVNVCRKLAAPSAEQEPPDGQSLHSVELTFSLSLPAGHVKQLTLPSSRL